MKVPSAIKALVTFLAIVLFLQYGIAPLTEFVTGVPAPLPSSIVQMFAILTVIGILLYYSVREQAWEEFSQPIVKFLRGGAALSRGVRVIRVLVLVAVPLLAGGWGYARMSRPPEAPADPPGIHFNLPRKYATTVNPLPWTQENVRAGGIVYTRECGVCHGDALDGNGPFARAWQPKPANFRDSGTIAQLSEGYVFWRIKEGAPGLPAGTIGYRSAMPAFDGILSDDQIWKCIIYTYTAAGQTPAERTEFE